MRGPKPDTLFSLFARRRGIAVFMAALVLLSVSILALSTMTRISETSERAGQAMLARKVALIADAAVRVALADLTEQFLNYPSGSPDFIYANATNSSGGEGTPRLLVDRYTDEANPIPLFGYRAKASQLLVGDGTKVLPGSEIPVGTNYTCYHVTIDVTDILQLGTVTSTDAGAVAGFTGYYYGTMKSVGMTTCFKKRNN